MQYLVDNEIIFSTRLSIFSFNLSNGYLNWKENIGSIITPIIDGDNIFLISDTIGQAETASKAISSICERTN